MLRLNDVFKYKELWLLRYGSMRCDDKNEWYFGGTENK